MGIETKDALVTRTLELFRLEICRFCYGWGRRKVKRKRKKYIKKITCEIKEMNQLAHDKFMTILYNKGIF